MARALARGCGCLWWRPGGSTGALNPPSPPPYLSTHAHHIPLIPPHAFTTATTPHVLQAAGGETGAMADLQAQAVAKEADYETRKRARITSEFQSDNGVCVCVRVCVCVCVRARVCVYGIVREEGW